MNFSIYPSLNFGIKNNNEIYKKNKNTQNYISRENIAFDQVTFSGKQKAADKITNTFQDIVRRNYESKLPDYKILSVKFMDTLEAVANKLKGYGIVFDREYCEQAAVKKTDSFLSKFIRSGSTPSDQIRATLYMENPYDLGVFNEKVLPELRGRGYDIQLIPDEVVGKKVKSKKRDFDVRLADVNYNDLKVLDEDLRHSISGPQKSGYEDIQMRLVDTLTTGKNKPPHELLIIFGKNYAAAKHNESYYVYDIVRALSKRLHIAQVEKPELYSPAKRVIDNINIIRGQLNNAISRPLFVNAKNLDFYKDEFQLPVELSKSTCDALCGLVEGIRNKIPLHYGAELKKINSKEFEPEIIKMIRNSQDFKDRDDKTLYVQDIRKMKSELNKETKSHRKDDLELIQAVQDRLAETIKKYGKKD